VCVCVCVCVYVCACTVIPRLTSDPANEFSASEDFFRCFSDSANECFSGCAR